MPDKLRPIEYASENREPLSDAEMRAFWLAIPVVLGTLLAALIWTIAYYAFH